MRPSAVTSEKAFKLLGESPTTVLAEIIVELPSLQPIPSVSAQHLAAPVVKRTIRSKRGHLESQIAQIRSPNQAPLPVDDDLCTRNNLSSQLDAVRERPNIEEVMIISKNAPYLTDTPSSSAIPSSSSTPSLLLFYSSSAAQFSASTLNTETSAYMRVSSSLLSTTDGFPCRRIDKCKWSLLDETVSKYEDQRKVMGRSRRGWKSRRITLNSQLDDGDIHSIEPQACLHLFKQPDMDTKETERLILTGNSFAAVVESSKQFGGGKWIIKVHGIVLGAKKETREDGRREGDWLLQFMQLERMQVWLKHLKSLINQVKEIEYAFRRGQSSHRPLTAMSLRSREKRRLCSDYDGCEEDDSHDYQSDSVEELAASTDSLPIKPQFPPRTTSRQSNLKKSRSYDVASTREELRGSTTPSPSPYNDKLRSESNTPTNANHSVSSIRSHSSVRPSASLQVEVPSTPIQLRRSTSPSSHYSFASSQQSNPWDSPLTSSTQSQWQSSLSSPATSVDTRSSVSSQPQSSPKTPINNFTSYNARKRKEVALRLEAQSLRPTIASRLSLDPSCILDSPTDPETDAPSVLLHQSNSDSLFFTLLETRPDLVLLTPTNLLHESQIGLAL